MVLTDHGWKTDAISVAMAVAVAVSMSMSVMWKGRAGVL